MRLKRDVDLRRDCADETSLGGHSLPVRACAAMTCAAALTTAAMRPTSRSCCVVSPFSFSSL